jgi:hypothetical protein
LSISPQRQCAESSVKLYISKSYWIENPIAREQNYAQYKKFDFEFTENSRHCLTIVRSHMPNLPFMEKSKTAGLSNDLIYKVVAKISEKSAKSLFNKFILKLKIKSLNLKFSIINQVL